MKWRRSCKHFPEWVRYDRNWTASDTGCPKVSMGRGKVRCIAAAGGHTRFDLFACSPATSHDDYLWFYYAARGAPNDIHGASRCSRRPAKTEKEIIHSFIHIIVENPPRIGSKIAKRKTGVIYAPLNAVRHELLSTTYIQFRGLFSLQFFASWIIIFTRVRERAQNCSLAAGACRKSE